jgi:hypothetical protein
MSSQQKLPPYLLVKILGGFRRLLLRIHRKLFPGSVVLYEQFQSFWLMQPIYIAAELNIASYLKDKPLSVYELAEKTDTNPEALYRVLRALASSGIFKETGVRQFKLNSPARALLDGDGSLKNMIIHHLDPINWSANGNLLHTVKTGENAFTGKFGMDIYPYLRQDKDEMQKFAKSMSDLSAMAINPLLSKYDFSRFTVIADIGGGEGFLLIKILEKYAGLKGLLFDLPENKQKAEDFIKSSAMSGRINFTPGNFLEPFSLKADLYLMKNVLHNWDDDRCSLILGNLRKTMPYHSLLLIFEMVVPGPGKDSFSKLVDIQMLSTMPGGRERTRQEFEELLKKSGFSLRRIIPTVAPLSILETVGE